MLARLVAPAAALLVGVLAACAPTGGDDAQEVDPLETPRMGACRLLSPEAVEQPSDQSPTVDCSEKHTAETFAVGTFPGEIAKGADPQDPELGAHIYRTCQKRFQAFLGGDESMVMRSILRWAWFRPSDEAWDKGARWFRCDVVAGGDDADELITLPEGAKGLLSGRPDDEWMTCARGETVAGSTKVPCSEPHDWRAVTTIQLGRPDDPYPGDDVVAARTRDFCSDSVGAWLNYPVDYDFGYTFFHKAEWKAGNRRSICWAKTDE